MLKSNSTNMSTATLFDIDPNVRKNLVKSFGRTEETLEDDVRSIREWLKTQKHLPEIMEDSKIRSFLLSNGCSIEVTKQKIDMYYTMRNVFPEFFTDCNPKLDHLKNFQKTTLLCLHPKLIEGKYRTWFFKTKEPNKYDPYVTSKKFLAIEEIRSYEDVMVEDIFIVDAGNFSINDVNNFSVSYAAKILAVYDKIFSFPLHKMHIINSPSYINKIISVFKLILPSNMFARIIYHQDDKILNDIFTKDELPKDYGGNGPSLQELADIVDQKLVEYQKRFDSLDNLKVNEALRPQKLSNDEILGYYGNFKNTTNE